ncbi:prepilin-type N-terminal cleavage/methylation domain-containing protein [Desulfuromonas thiophila]|uniref:Prepilin-type N-terminal cleavage/methylation domain-containing protein n=1 Tax=Desulfuromonas thiophila TaxID=57664 RepID=A0A1G6ZL62_9BACT|nr:prepilin-type N-terminal cleavage/methylation domain-containing protein [Desulfuromonas thiophila]SDE03153.1 prepilin-type N-terminal cleavage/methylation domain-containing protein [Desulfuromonas thiophila]
MRNAKGFTLIELVVVLVVLSLLAAVAVPKFIEVTKQAEASAVKGVLGSLRSALSLRMAQGLSTGADLSLWASTGGTAGERLYPMDDLLLEKPETYLGIIAGSEQRGYWYDDADNHEVVYVFKNDDVISGGSGATPKKLRFRIARVDNDGVVDGPGPTAGLMLAAAQTYSWNF